MQLETNNTTATIVASTITGSTPTAKSAAKGLAHSPAPTSTAEGFYYTSALEETPRLAHLHKKAEHAIERVKTLVATKPMNNVKNLKALNAAVEKAFADVKIYGLVGLWTLTSAEMRNIDSTQDVQQSVMDMQNELEQLASSWSTFYTAVLKNDETFVLDVASSNLGSQDKATQVSVANSIYSNDSTSMQTLGSSYSSLNNSTSNTVSTVGQNLSTDGSTIQQVVTKVMDTLSQILGTI